MYLIIAYPLNKRYDFEKDGKRLSGFTTLAVVARTDDLGEIVDVSIRKAAKDAEIEQGAVYQRLLYDDFGRLVCGSTGGNG